MNSSSLCAIVVTFHPERDVAQHLAAIRPQVGALLVDDNGSNDAELAMLRVCCASLGATLIENGDNLGVASALNIGVEWAARNGFEWVLLFDQDSEVSAGFSATMLEEFVRREATSRVGILVPAYKDLRSGDTLKPERGENGALEVAMTSGSLLRTSTFAEAGPFADELFIDAVDHEYSLRLRARGYSILECGAAVLLHSPGNPRIHHLFGWRYETANYSPVRRYYQERNKIWLARRYFRRFPAFSLRMFRRSATDFAKILLHEGDKVRKCKFFLRGVMDGLRGRTGRILSA